MNPRVLWLRAGTNRCSRDPAGRVAVAVVVFLYGPLAADPYRVRKPLPFHLEGYWSARRGQYRVIYSIKDAEAHVCVVRISHHADAYGESRSFHPP